MTPPDVQTAEQADERAQAKRPEIDPGAGGASTDPTKDNSKTHEIGGPQGLEPTRYGDWERAGRCIDF